MSELVIEKHNFDIAKEQLKRFSEEIPEDLTLRKVDDDKDFGEFFGDLIFGRGLGLDHKVTGEELNELTTDLQKHFHEINDTQIKLIKQFGEVYNTFEYLDKEYIQAILISIKTVEETSKKVEKNQKDIARVVYNQEKMLKVINERLDKCAHFNDIDDLWIEFQEKNKAIQTNSSVIEKIMKKIKIAYLLAGGAIGIAICELVLILCQVM